MKQNKRKKLPKNIPEDMELTIFENNISGYWKVRNKNKLVININGLIPFNEECYHIRQLESIIEDYDILYLDMPGIGASSDAIPFSDGMKEVYKSCLRYKTWERIGFVGIEYGAVIISELYKDIEKNKMRLPDWIIQINGFTTIDSFVIHKVPWYMQIICKYISKKYSSIKNYENLKKPLFLYHCKNNQNVPFIESMILYRKIGESRCKFIPLYGHDEMTLLSRENKEIISDNIQSVL